MRFCIQNIQIKNTPYVYGYSHFIYYVRRTNDFYADNRNNTMRDTIIFIWTKIEIKPKINK